jgi:hypothetical protein
MDLWTDPPEYDYVRGEEQGCGAIEANAKKPRSVRASVRRTRIYLCKKTSLHGGGQKGFIFQL